MNKIHLEKLLSTLMIICEKLNNEHIEWALGASLALYKYGLIEYPNDIDIIVNVNHVEILDKKLKLIGIKKHRENAAAYSTKYFYEYIINEMDVDVMAGLMINHDEGGYEFIFDSSSITDYMTLGNFKIALTSLEDWYVLYQLIPGREAKVRIIENYLKKEGIKNKVLLLRALQGNLPENIRQRINCLLQ